MWDSEIFECTWTPPFTFRQMSLVKLKTFFMSFSFFAVENFALPTYFDFFSMYSCNKITKTWIQISHQNQNVFFLNIIHQRMIWQNPIVSRSKTKWYNQIFAMIIFCLSYFITTVCCHNHQAFNLAMTPRLQENFRFLLEYVPPIWILQIKLQISFINLSNYRKEIK